MSIMDTGWLDPKGKLYYANYMDHYAVSEEIIEQQGFKSESNENCDDVLLRNGYVRISMQRFLSFGIVFGFPHKEILEECGKEMCKFRVPYVSPQQREYIRKMYDTNRDLFSKYTRDDLRELKIITEEEYREWIREADPERYAKWYTTE